jgi:hypothetical protein
MLSAVEICSCFLSPEGLPVHRYYNHELGPIIELRASEATQLYIEKVAARVKKVSRRVFKIQTKLAQIQPPATLRPNSWQWKECLTPCWIRRNRNLIHGDAFEVRQEASSIYV